MATQSKTSKRKQEDTTVQVTKLPKERADTYASFYSNHVEIVHTPWDFHVTFYEVAENAEGKFIRAEKGKVFMSPQHAKAFLNVFAANVQNWEKQFSSLETSQKGSDDIEAQPSKQLH